MHIITDLSHIPFLSPPIGLTIGTFDGMHLGHQALLHQLKQCTLGGSQAVLTFTNPPTGVSQLCTLDHKLKQFEQGGISLVLLFHFTPEFASQPFDLFLTHLHEKLPFSHLVLGEEATFGKDRQGTPERIRALSKHLFFEVTYIPKHLIDDQPVSSARIRKALQEGNLKLVHQLLGRPYSIIAPCAKNQTVNLQSLCLPPSGPYEVLIHLSSESKPLLAQVDLSQEARQLTIHASSSIISSNPIEIEFK